MNDVLTVSSRDESRKSAGDVSRTVAVLRRGGIVILPTQRWYMICCDAERQDLVEEIHAAKERPVNKPLLLLAPDVDYLRRFFQVSPSADVLAELLLPGELTLLMTWRSAEKQCRYVSARPEGTFVSVAPGLMGAVASAFGSPLACTSANVSGPYCPNGPGPAISIAQVMAFVSVSGLAVTLTVDGGICPSFQPTTIVDATDTTSPPRIVRPGFVHEEAIEMALSAGEAA